MTNESARTFSRSPQRLTQLGKLLYKFRDFISKKYFALILNLNSEAVGRRCSVKKVFLKLSQNSQNNTCARIPFLMKLQADEACSYIKKEPLAQVFSCEICEFFKKTVFTEHFRWLFLHEVDNEVYDHNYFISKLSCIFSQRNLTFISTYIVSITQDSPKKFFLFKYLK